MFILGDLKDMAFVSCNEVEFSPLQPWKDYQRELHVPSQMHSVQISQSGRQER